MSPIGGNKYGECRCETLKLENKKNKIVGPSVAFKNDYPEQNKALKNGYPEQNMAFKNGYPEQNVSLKSGTKCGP